MQAVFKKILTQDEVNDILSFMATQGYCSVLQYPQWNNAINKAKKVCYYLGKIDGKIVCYALIVENFLEAKISFGPCGIDAGVIADSVVKIFGFYKARGFASLEIQLGMPLSQKTEEIEYAVRKKLQFTQKINKENWTTIEVLLNREPDTLFESFSQNHKRSIAKAGKHGLKAIVLNDEASIREFARLFDAMYKHRKQVPPFACSNEVLMEIYGLFQMSIKGFFIGVVSPDNELMGGACYTICNNTIMYQYGCTSTVKQLPVLHLAFFEAMKIATRQHIERMDLCGYNLLIEESDQVFQINRFKAGFKGEIVYYPRKMIFTLSAFKKGLFCGLKWLYNLWRGR